VRLGVVNGLPNDDAPGAIAGLIRLTSDDGRDVRDWATFGLGSLTDVDTPELRDALMARMSEDDDEIRGEALIGVARRRRPEALGVVLRELSRPFAGDWAIEAAEILAEVVRVRVLSIRLAKAGLPTVAHAYVTSVSEGWCGSTDPALERSRCEPMFE
jgi:HEAT repeat protein